MLTFFNIQLNNKAVKEASKVVLDKIFVNQKLFVPFLAKTYDLAESALYDNLDDGMVEEGFETQPLLEGVSQMYHTDKEAHDPATQVMIRLLCPF